MNTRKWVRPARWDRILFNPFFFRMLIKDTLREKPRQIKIQRLRKVRIWAFGPLAYQINKRFVKLKQMFKNIKQLLAKLRYLRLFSTLYLSSHWLLIWQFCMEMMRFQSQCSQLKKRVLQILKKVFVFQKICFKAKVLERFKIL